MLKCLSPLSLEKDGREVWREGVPRLLYDQVTHIREIHHVQNRLNLYVLLARPSQILPMQRNERGIVIQAFFHVLQHRGTLFHIGFNAGFLNQCVDFRVTVIAGVILASATARFGAEG